MKLCDKRIIQFLTNSPMPSLLGMADALRYLHGQRIWEDLEYDLLGGVLGDNAQRKVLTRVSIIDGITAHALLHFVWYVGKTHMV